MTLGEKIAEWLEAHIAENNGAWSSEQLAAEIDQTIEIEKEKNNPKIVFD